MADCRLVVRFVISWIEIVRNSTWPAPARTDSIPASVALGSCRVVGNRVSAGEWLALMTRLDWLAEKEFAAMAKTCN